VRARFNPQTDFVIVKASCCGTSGGWESWRRGVAAILPPTIIVGGDGGGMARSGRSVEGFDSGSGAARMPLICWCVTAGHAMAAGLTVEAENLEALRAR